MTNKTPKQIDRHSEAAALLATKLNNHLSLLAEGFRQLNAMTKTAFQDKELYDLIVEQSGQLEDLTLEAYSNARQAHKQASLAVTYDPQQPKRLADYNDVSQILKDTAPKSWGGALWRAALKQQEKGSK